MRPPDAVQSPANGRGLVPGLGLACVLGMLCVAAWIVVGGEPTRDTPAHGAELPQQQAVPVGSQQPDPGPVALRTAQVSLDPTDPAADASARWPASSREHSAVAPDRGHPSELRARMHQLQPGREPGELLAAAREVLADGVAGALTLRALMVLGEFDPQAVLGALLRLVEMGETQPQAHRLVASAVRSFGHQEAVLSPSDLHVLFETGVKEVQIAAASSLEARGDDALVRRYQTLRVADLSHEDESVRASAAEALAALRSPSSIPLLVPLLSDPVADVRLAALAAVRDSGGEEVLEQVRPLQQDRSERVRLMATRMVKTMERRQELQREAEERIQAMRQGGLHSDGR